MLTVRFPNGMAVQYNGANFVNSDDPHGSRIYTKRDGGLVARVQHSAGAIIEFVPACHVYQALNDPSGDRIDSILRDVQAMNRKLSKLSTGERKVRRG